MTPLSLYVRLRINLFLLILILLVNKSWSQTACYAHFNHYSTHNPDSVHFYPTGTTATHYYWTFGDGTTSTSHDPWHFYLHPGVYFTCLTIVDSAGVTCHWCDSIHVGNPPPPVCNAHFNHYSTHNPDSVHFYPTGTAATHYYWTFGDGTTSTSRDPWHFYLHPGVYFT